ncbi:MAG TPA: RidA family protein [Usitatibacter sp.]|nr:RidA family protein [Usitatibacter sp.]
MAGRIDAHLKAKGIDLPNASAPAANYVPFTRTGNIVYVSGQVSQWNGERKFIGKLGAELGVSEGQQAARLCALNLVAHARVAADGDLDRVRVLRLTGYVNSAPDFTNQPQVVNGASDVMVEIFGEAGKHARSAVGVASLPGGVAVEVEAIFEIVAG